MSAVLPLSEPEAPPLDLAALLTPLDGPSPAGGPARGGPLYRRLTEARRGENASLPQGVWKRDVKRADWSVVTDLASTILATQAKDLQVAAWLVEAEVHRRGFAALADGFALIEGLCRDFWPDLHPAIDPTDPEVRNAPFDWLNEKLPILLQQIPLTRSGIGTEVSYCWTDLVNAQRHEVARQHDPRAAARAEEAGRVTLAAFSDSTDQTPTGLFLSLHHQLTAARTAIGGAQQQLDRLAGSAAPSLIGLIRQVEEIADWARMLLVERHALPTAKVERAEEDAVSEDPRPGPGDDEAEMPAPSGPIRSREDAYRQLAEAADYLFRTEPHSPVPYLIHRAIAWGQMPLHELLPEMTRGRGDISLFMELLGIGQNQ